MLVSDLQEALIEDGFAFIQGVLLEGCVWGMNALGTGDTVVGNSGRTTKVLALVDNILRWDTCVHVGV